MNTYFAIPIAALCLVFMSACDQPKKAPSVGSDGRPKTGYGQAVDSAKKLSKALASQDTLRQEQAAAVGQEE